MSRARGITRERQVRAYLENDGWFVARAAGSLGDADLIALKAGHTSKLIEVKSTAAGPFHSFGPNDRAALLIAADKAGAEAVLAYWPPSKPLTWIRSEDWPYTPPPALMEGIAAVSKAALTPWPPEAS